MCDGHDLFVTGVVERWELLQAQSNLPPWQQLTSDLYAMEAWLNEAEEELNLMRGLDFSTDIHTIQQRIRKLKVRMCVQVCVCVYVCVCIDM